MEKIVTPNRWAILVPVEKDDRLLLWFWHWQLQNQSEQNQNHKCCHASKKLLGKDGIQMDIWHPLQVFLLCRMNKRVTIITAVKRDDFT